MLTTGVDAPMIKNVVIARVVGSMAEFKQIIGRGTRVRDDYGKTFFNIIDYTGSATRQFADPAFDGEPALIDETTIDTDGNVIAVQVGDDEMPSPPPEEGGMEYEPGGFPGVTVLDPDADDLPPRKYYVDGGTVAIVASMVYEYDAQGKKQRIVKYADYTADAVRTLSPSAAILRNYWADADARGGILLKLAERGIDFDLLAEGDRPARRRPLRSALPCGLQRAAAHAARAGRAPAPGDAGFLRPLCTRGARHPRRVAGEVRRTWRGAVCNPRRAQAAAHRRPRQRGRDRAALWRRAAVARCRGGVAGAAVCGVDAA
jgi:hypothetical protein